MRSHFRFIKGSNAFNIRLSSPVITIHRGSDIIYLVPLITSLREILSAPLNLVSSKKNGLLKLMISSRCDDEFPSDTEEADSLTEIRENIKRQIENETVFEKQIFDVWINEASSSLPANADSWEHCLKQVRSADILLVLYNGNAGWTNSKGDIGICHAELEEGINTAPGKIILISIFDENSTKKPNRPADKRFQEYVKTQSLFRTSASDIESLFAQVKKALQEILITLTSRGVRESSKGRFHTGQALDWSRLNFSDRSEEIKETIVNTIAERFGYEYNSVLRMPVYQDDILIIPNAIPAALSISAAREMVGQPFLRDHENIELLEAGKIGPIHIIGCHKGVTERQAMSLLGVPDVTLVTAPFGIYAADNILKGTSINSVQ